MFLAWQIVFWLLRDYPSKSNFDVFQVTFKGNRRLNWWNPVRFYMEWMFSLMVIVKYVLETHSTCKLFEIGQQMAFDFNFVSHWCRDKSNPFQQNAYLAVSQSVIWEILKKFLVCLPFFVQSFFVWRFFSRTTRNATPGGGGTVIYGPYRYVPLWRVWFSSSLL